MGKFAVGSAWHCTGPSLDESLSSPRFRLLVAAILLASVGSVEPLRESTSLVGVSPRWVPCRPLRGDASSFHPRFLSFLVSFSSGTAAAAAAISRPSGWAGRRRPRWPPAVRALVPLAPYPPASRAPPRGSVVSLTFLFSSRNSTARADALSPIVSHTR